MRDDELFSKMEDELYSAVISDSLDRVGIRNHTASISMRPLNPKMVVAGRASTMQFASVKKVPDEPYEMIIRALDGLSEGQLPFLAAADLGVAIWGELLSTATRARGARGAIVDGITRDVKSILKMNFPVFCTGTAPTDSSGRADVLKIGAPVHSGDTTIRNGDLLFADIDGVVVIPKEVEKKVLRLSFDKAKKENVVRSELMRGKLLREVWEKHKVL